VEEPYRKDMSHLSWDEVFARQVRRAGLIEAWLDALQLQPGARVLDIGAGPGYVSLVLADRVGPEGLIYAVDRSADALAYLERLQRERGVPQIRRVVGDALTLDPGALHPDAALVTMVLHHTDDPPGILANVARLLPAGALAVVAEFHPEGPCEVGPPREGRLSPDQLRAWSEAAGFEILTYTRQTPEHYMWVVQRRPVEYAPHRNPFDGG
jgi:ubiquinone/menaquinone biosynthesis C-methylase UbiE